MPPGQWHSFGEWMFHNGLLKRDPQAQNAMTDEFLAGQGS
jgi:hypothetical protein